MQKQVLEDRKTQLLQIPDGMSTLETQYESLQTTLFQLETQKAAIQTKKQEAIQQFTDAETELNIQQQQLSGAASGTKCQYPVYQSRSGNSEKHRQTESV